MIYITGDTHGSIDIEKFDTIRSFIKPEDYIIICGDFGVYWDMPIFGEETANSYLKEFYSALGCTILWVDGNHENFELVNKLPTEIKFGGKVHTCWEGCYHLMRGETYTIEGITFFAFGGAESVDKQARIPYVTWWPQEIPTTEEMDKGLEQLNKGKFDVVLTHDAPYRWIADYYSHPQTNVVNKYLDYLYSIVDFDYWFFGHHHVDEDFPEYAAAAVYNRFVAVYKDDKGETITDWVDSV